MQTVVLEVPVDDVEVAVDVLWRLGVRAIEERGGSDGRVELRTAVGDAALDEALATTGGRWSVRSEAPEPAADTWRAFATPVRICDDLVVVPAWLPAPMEVDPASVVRIEPGATFGLGDHPTTALTLAALARTVQPGDTVLDVGCGSGVLAIAAVRCGAGWVRAVDVAAAAVEATADNARRNGVEDRIEVDSAALDDVAGPFDVVVANLLGPALVELSDHLRRATATDGRLVVSGILADRHEHVLAAMAPMVVERTDVSDGWAAVTLRHAAAG